MDEKKIKDRILVILIAAFVIICIILILAGVKLERQAQLIKQKDTVIGEKNAVIEYHISDKGKIIAQKEAAELRAKDLKDAYPEIYKFIKEELDINAKHMKAFVRNEFVAMGTGTGSIVNNHYYDSSTNSFYDSLKYKASDGYMSFNVNFELKYQNNKLEYTQSPFVYTYSDTATTVIHGKKKWFFGSEKLYATTTFANSGAKITGTTNILVNNYRDKRFAIGLSGGWGIVFPGGGLVQTGFFIGPTFSYTLYKF